MYPEDEDEMYPRRRLAEPLMIVYVQIHVKYIMLLPQWLQKTQAKGNINTAKYVVQTNKAIKINYT